MRSMPPVYTINKDPNTYYHSNHRPFAPAYNDQTFNAIGYSGGDPVIYNRGSCGGDVLVVGGGSGFDDPGYTTQVGSTFSVAFNDSSFNHYSTAPRGDRIVYYN